MPFTPFVVVTRSADLTSGWSASLKKMRSAPAQLSFALREPIAAQLGWVDGTVLAVELGDGEHHGLVRLKPDEAGTARVSRRVSGDGVKRGGAYFAIALGHVPAFVNRTETKKWCQFELVEDSWVEVVLPSWADETGVKRQRIALPGPQHLQLPPPPMRSLTASLAGDPPPHRSALAQRPRSRVEASSAPRSGPGQPLGGVEPTRGQARARAERIEDAEYAGAEAARWNRQANFDDKIANLTTVFGLTRTEARYLHALLDGRVKSKEALLAAGHDDGDDVEIKIVDVYTHKLRKKLKTQLVDIETIWGQGYRMAPEMIARVMVLVDGGAPGRDQDEADLAALGDVDETAAEPAE